VRFALRYDPKNCGQLRCALPNKVMRDWLIEDHYRQTRKAEKEYKKKLLEAQKIKQAASWGEPVKQIDLIKANEFLKAHQEKEDAKEQERLEREAEQRALQEEQDELDRGGKKELTAEEILELEEQKIENDKNAADAVEEGDQMLALVEEPKEGEKEQLSVIEVAEPELMKPENEEAAIEWLLDRLKLSRNRRSKKTRLILQYEEDDDIKDEVAVKMQGIWRGKKAREKSRHKCRQQYEKMYDKTNYCYYYVNKRTGDIQWHKPHVMGSEDLDDPVDEWREITNAEDGSSYFQNPATGQIAYMSEDTAVRFLQRLVRKYQSRDIPQPTMEEVVKALRFQRVAEDNYAKYVQQTLAHNQPQALTLSLAHVGIRRSSRTFATTRS
jgi:hypothetical protein